MEDDLATQGGCWTAFFVWAGCVALPFLITDGPMDRNQSGDFTVSDIWAIGGTAATWWYQTLYDIATPVFYFFEVYYPVLPTRWSSVIGWLIWLAFTYLAVILAAKIGAHVDRAGQTDKPSGPATN